MNRGKVTERLQNPRNVCILYMIPSVRNGCLFKPKKQTIADTKNVKYHGI